MERTTPLGETATYMRVGDSEHVAFTFVDHLRDGAADAVSEFKAQGKDVVLLSGDAPAAVAEIAARVGIDAWEAECLPEGKAQRIGELNRAGRKVLMVGDGLNDTAALAAAHVSISPASALEATRVVSDIVLLGGSLAPLGEAAPGRRFRNASHQGKLCHRRWLQRNRDPDCVGWVCHPSGRGFGYVVLLHYGFAQCAAFAQLASEGSDQMNVLVYLIPVSIFLGGVGLAAFFWSIPNAPSMMTQKGTRTVS